jgi:hemerythrin
MEMYKWTEALETNNIKIDNDHKLIIDMAQELNEAMSRGRGKERVNETLTFLTGYVKKHFDDEEKLQLKNNYPDFLEHKKNHTYFINELDLLSQKIIAEPTSTVNTLALNKLISGWFFNHIRKMDVEVAKHLKISE